LLCFQGIGRVALWSTLLGILLGIHATAAIYLTCFYTPSAVVASTTAAAIVSPRLLLLWQWSLYGTGLSTFHLLEFWITALYNPNVASSDSFLVNHSAAYTAAALTSWLEFMLRYVLAPKWNVSPVVVWFGWTVLVLAQALRSTAMAVAGPSFNHHIQGRKADTHVLVTRSVYRFLRHPSYVGFFYWSMATQIVLGNLFNAILYTVFSWSFFHCRIAYEEETLDAFFPNEYVDYANKTYSGIPFIYTHLVKQERTRR
jgi:protein-S-isoprenylcysteine O-methyltransferase